jgi:oligopeptide transport system permease protein
MTALWSRWLWPGLRDLGGALLTLVLVIALCLALLRQVPGGPFDAERLAPPEVQAALAARYRLDQSYWVQLGDYLGHAVQGDLGPSFQQADFNVAELIAGALPLTLAFGAAALLLAVLLALASGIVAGWREGWAARGGQALASVLQATPKFVLGPLLVGWLALAWGWLPVSGHGQGAAGWILPVLTLALPQWAWLHRVVAQQMAALRRSLPWRAAVARGLVGSALLWQFALPLLASRVAASGAPVAIALLTGSAVVEQVYGIPGMGRLLLSAAINRDYTLVLGVVAVSAGLLLAVGWLLEALQRWLDPRLRPR